MTATKVIFDGGVKTQSVESVKSLLNWRGRGSDPMPSFIEVGKGEGRVVLVLSNKKDAYYTTTSRGCSCPSAVYSPAMACKHMRHHFPHIAKPSREGSAGSIRPTEGWIGPDGERANGPVEPRVLPF